MIMDPHCQKDKWKVHCTELLNPPLSNVNLTDIDSMPTQPSFGYLLCYDGPPTRYEVSLFPEKNLKAIKAQEWTG